MYPIMKEKLCSEMSSFLSNKELMLNEFRLFYDKNKDSDKFIELFDEEYGAMYEAFKGSVKYSTPIKTKAEVSVQTPALPNAISEHEYRSDVRIIRKWVQFFGIIVIVSIALSLIGSLIVVLNR